MSRALFRHVVQDQAGNVIQNAKSFLYLEGTLDPVVDAWDAQAGGSPVTFLISNDQGEIGCWFDSAKRVSVVTTDNSNTAYYPAAPAATVSFSDIVELVDCMPPPAEVTVSSQLATEAAARAAADALRIPIGTDTQSAADGLPVISIKGRAGQTAGVIDEDLIKPVARVKTDTGDTRWAMDKYGVAVWYDPSKPDNSPYRVSSYLNSVGSYQTGAWVEISNKRKTADGTIQGVSALADGSEPHMLGVSPDVDGPGLALEGKGTPGTNNSALAVYDMDDIIGGATPWSQGYGRKKFALAGKGQMLWGADLSDDPWVLADLILERSGADLLNVRHLQDGAGKMLFGKQGVQGFKTRWAHGEGGGALPNSYWSIVPYSGQFEAGAYTDNTLAIGWNTEMLQAGEPTFGDYYESKFRQSPADPYQVERYFQFISNGGALVRRPHSIYVRRDNGAVNHYFTGRMSFSSSDGTGQVGYIEDDGSFVMVRGRSMALTSGQMPHEAGAGDTIIIPSADYPQWQWKKSNVAAANMYVVLTAGGGHNIGDFIFDPLGTGRFRVRYPGGEEITLTRQAAVANPAGGAVIDIQARAQLALLLDRLRPSGVGIIAP